MLNATGALSILLIGLASLHVVHAENWPAWRGPRGDGTSAERELPVTWDVTSGENIVWRRELPGKGHSSPIVWGNRLFVSTCLTADQQRSLLCLETESGRELWRSTLLEAPLETIHRLNSYASGTPATDGQLIFVAFLKVDGHTIPAPNVGRERDVTPGTMVLFALDFDGNTVWKRELGEFISAHGFCSSPVLYRDLVIVNGDQDGNGYLVALNKRTGAEVWRTRRKHGVRSYVTPIIRNVEGSDQLVLSGSKHVASFDPVDGKLVWSVEGPTEQYVASMVFDGERFMLAAGFPTHHVMSIRADGRGDVTDTHVEWHVDKRVRCYVPSPISLGWRLFVADDRGTANCFDTRSGQRLWTTRLAGAFSASLTAAGDRVYFLDGDGTTHVVESGHEPRVISENKLGEPCHASPAISGGSIYVRGETHLFRIGKRAG